MLVSRQLNTAYWALRVGFGFGPLLAGLDKFTNILVNWDKYLSPAVLRILPVTAMTFMRGVGVIEIVVGVAILFWNDAGFRLHCDALVVRNRRELDLNRHILRYRCSRHSARH